jgi:hypothetical protein
MCFYNIENVLCISFFLPYLLCVVTGFDHLFAGVNIFFIIISQDKLLH